MTGAALAPAAPAAASVDGEFGHVLNGVALEGTAAQLAKALEPVFLAEAGWDPVSRVLSLPAEHPLLGRRLCRVDGCTATAHGTKIGGQCYRCFTRLMREGRSREEIVTAAELPPLLASPADCLMPGCQRMSPGGRQGQRTGLCQAHSRRFRRSAGMTMETFLADPWVRPLAPLWPCQVAACSRRSESEHGYRPTHYVRWRTTVTAAPDTDQRHWQLTCPAVSEGGQVSLRGLAPLVVVQVLAGIQHHVRGHGAKITDVNLQRATLYEHGTSPSSTSWMSRR
ncbi:hypothetical protein [Nonomuraea turcica]|uniref:hypothetical protein n=1 Tax=Nonomuraea sp. G32 TaxID=3067274 RepID=UPI00273B0344|nr:hypothetical protein [Nonomuraea sp. G32]MDP4506929.1 hypothetical protein [Nonomuraea sp. G32]